MEEADGLLGSSTGSREDAEIALARLKVADQEKRLPGGETNVRSVRAALHLSSGGRRRAYRAGPSDGGDRPVAANRMCSTVLAPTSVGPSSAGYGLPGTRTEAVEERADFFAGPADLVIPDFLQGRMGGRP